MDELGDVVERLKPKILFPIVLTVKFLLNRTVKYSFLWDNIQKADAIVFVFTVLDHSISGVQNQKELMQSMNKLLEARVPGYRRRPSVTKSRVRVQPLGLHRW